MKKNMGAVDRGLRILAAIAIAILHFTGILSGLFAFIIVIAAIFILTSFISFCPLYYPFGFSTRERGLNR